MLSNLRLIINHSKEEIIVGETCQSFWSKKFKKRYILLSSTFFSNGFPSFILESFLRTYESLLALLLL